MPEVQDSDFQGPPTPEKRSHRVDSSNPTDPMPKYEAGNEVWFRPSVKEAFGAFKIADVKKDEDGGFVYQILGTNNKPYNKGEWVPQKKMKKAEGCL